jgi:hypothetical protein
MAGPNFWAASLHPCEASWGCLLPTKRGHGTLQCNIFLFLKAQVCQSIHFTVAKWLLEAWEKKKVDVVIYNLRVSFWII